MSTKTENAKKVIDELSPEELRVLAEYLRTKLPRHPLEARWNISADLILDAINRSQDITQRGVRGVIAEAVFEREVIPKLRGWEGEALTGDWPFDFRIKRVSDGKQIRIQVKLQRTQAGEPLGNKKLYPEGYFVVEVQKTRGGKRHQSSSEVTDAHSTPEDTRPYRFGEFDVLAVNMQPSTRVWSRFMYTVADWLIPRQDKRLIEVMQPVSPTRSTVWTDSLEECIGWFLSGEKKQIYDLERAKADYKRAVGEQRRARKDTATAERLARKQQGTASQGSSASRDTDESD